MEKGMSRRSFFTGAAVAGTAGLGLLAGCAPAVGNDPAPTPESDAKIYDIIVVGAGLAGVCAALKSAELGKKTLLIDKAENLNMGSNSCISSGMFCFPYDTTQANKDKLYDVFWNKCQGEGDAALTRLIVDNVLEGMDWLRSYGAQFTEPAEAATKDHMTCFAAPGASQGMGPLLQTVTEAYRGLGGEDMSGTKMLDYVMDARGAVCGIKVRNAEGVQVLNAKAVINAAGGYVANRELMEMFVGPDSDEMKMRGQTSVTGDVILAAKRAGAALYQMGGMSSLHVGAVAPENPAAGNPYLAIPFTIAVNAEGKRYTDESLGYVNNGKELMGQANPVCALVFDSAIAEVPQVKTDFDKFERLGVPALEADSLAELAEKIGVPAAALEATVAEFNAATDGDKTTGLAVEKKQFAMKIEGPKFYAMWPLKPGSIMAFGGLHVDESCRVLEADETPIKGMYAAGECLGGIYKYDYQGGASVGRCISTGIAAAEAAAKYVG